MKLPVSKDGIVPLRARLAALVLVAGCGLMPGAARAENPTIYVVDMERVVNESIIGKAARTNVQEEVRKTESKLSLQRAELDKLRADIDAQAAVLAPAALDEKREAAARRARDFERTVQDKREELAKKQNLEMKKVVDEIDRVINSLSGSGSYPIIMEKDPQVVLYAADRVDLTAQVIATVDAEKVGR